MPVESTNPKLFKPALPRAPRLHGLFGTKNFRVHGFMEGDKWPPQALTDQYEQMVNMLHTHLRYKRLEYESEARKREDTFFDLREQCRGGRLRLKIAQAGDQLAIRTLISHDRTLERLYCSMPLYAIVKHADDNTFCKRRERDRLRYEQQTLMDLYKQKLLIKSDLEDRIKYESEFRIPEEFEIVKFRVDLSTTHTKLLALKSIQRAYKRMIGILKKDEDFYEPVIKSLEEDVVEQEKFIKLTVMLGLPAITGKEQSLREEYYEMESVAKKRVKQNLSLVDSFKKKTLKENATMIATVRKSMLTIGRKHKYVRESDSMTHLRTQREELEKTMKELQMITTAGKPTDIYPRFKITDIILKNEIKEKEFKDEMYSIISNTIKPTKGKKMETKHNYTEEEQTRLDTIESLKADIQAQKSRQSKEKQAKAETANCLSIMTKSLYHMLDVLRHVDKPLNIIERQYPNKTLALPLLDFESKPMKAYPPHYREEGVDVLMSRINEKIRSIVKKIPVDGMPDRDCQIMLREYRNKYAEIVEGEEEHLVAVEDDEEEEPPAKGVTQIPTRKQIKQQGIRIVEKALEEKELQGMM